MIKIIIINILLLSNIACSKINKPLVSVLPPSPSDLPSKSYQEVDIYKVAAYLSELGYFTYSLRQADIKSVTEAVKLFQQDIKVESTGLLDDITWEKLQKVRLSKNKQAELKTINTVFAIDKVECKSSHEAFVLFYQGELQDTDKVSINKRYALWYDTKREGINRKDWWCIPKKRFCSSEINFTDWRGKLKPGDIFQAKLITRSRSNLESLVATSFKDSCNKD
jgi:hypothetical protein